jgi:hypothetical protein
VGSLKITFMKKLKWGSLLGLALLIIIVVSTNQGCNKSEVAPNPETYILDLTILGKDSVFKLFLNDLLLYNLYVSNRQSDNVLSKSEFEFHFSKAVRENSLLSKKVISNAMGFTDIDFFWELNSKLNNQIAFLNRKYNLKKITNDQMRSFLKAEALIAFVSDKKISNAIRISMIDDSGNECLEKYNNCQMNATAIYAVELVGCVAVAGPLGWSPIGPIIYLACIGTSTYQLYTSDRICKTDFKYCK